MNKIKLSHLSKNFGIHCDSNLKKRKLSEGEYKSHISHIFYIHTTLLHKHFTTSRTTVYTYGLQGEGNFRTRFFQFLFLVFLVGDIYNFLHKFFNTFRWQFTKISDEFQKLKENEIVAASNRNYSYHKCVRKVDNILDKDVERGTIVH